MSYQTKKRIMNIISYAALAVVALSVIGVTVFTVASNGKKTGDDTKTPEETALTPTPTPTPSVRPQPTPTPTPDPQPTKADNTDLPADNKDPLTFSLPADGYIMKEHSVDLPVFSFTMNDYRTHNGIDISAIEGSTVKASAPGTVKDIYDDAMMGMTVEIDHGSGIVSVYSNLSDELPEGIVEGVAVGAGQTIGAVGSSSLMEVAESDHLHFEMRVNGECVNPLDYLSFESVEKVDSGVD